MSEKILLDLIDVELGKLGCRNEGQAAPTKPKRAKASRGIESRDVSPADAAHRIGLDADAFNAKLSNLIERGFPRPDPDTGRFDLIAVDRWCDTRHPHLFGGNAATIEARDANVVAMDRIAKIRGSRNG
jgi:hypothetical protein